MAVLLYLLLCVTPALAFELVARGLARWSSSDDPKPAGRHPRRRRHFFTRRQASRGESPQPNKASYVPTRFVPDCNRYRSDLRRLAETYDRLQTAQIPARALRMRAVEMAYDDILRDACAAYELARPPEHLDSASRLQVEADLLTAGLRW